MVAQLKTQKTCANCPNFTRSKVLPHIGFCQLYQQNTRSHDVAGNDCPPNQKPKRTKAPRKPQLIELVEVSGWKEDSNLIVY